GTRPRRNDEPAPAPCRAPPLRTAPLVATFLSLLSPEGMLLLSRFALHERCLHAFCCHVPEPLVALGTHDEGVRLARRPRRQRRESRRRVVEDRMVLHF